MAGGKMARMFGFEITEREPRGQARCGVLTTAHGTVHTPAFMPVGTAGSVKGVWPAQLRDSGTEIILANTYHLCQRPGAELVQRLGGLHTFMGWDGPILTDSGGYQVFSLAELNEITDEGVTFRSHIDGQRLHLDPASAMRIQHQLGADVIMAFDECPPGDGDRATVARAVERTVRWARQCKEVHARHQEGARRDSRTSGSRTSGQDDSRTSGQEGARRDSRTRGGVTENGTGTGGQALFGIVQGGVFHDLRRTCAEQLIELDFPGYAVGGLSVGETRDQTADVLGELTPILPAARPRYLMGVGTPADILAAVRAGVDMFDCVLPTRNGRNAYAFTRTGSLRLRNERYRAQDAPLEADCPCPTCRRFGRGYIRHLFLAHEMLGPILVTVHNLWFFQRLMARMRDLIPTGDWATMLADFPVAAEGGIRNILAEGASE